MSHRDSEDLLAERGIEVFYESIRMRRFKSTQQAQRFLSAHAAVYNLFNLGHHLVSAKHCRLFRENVFASWKCVTAL